MESAIVDTDLFERIIGIKPSINNRPPVESLHFFRVENFKHRGLISTAFVEVAEVILEAEDMSYRIRPVACHHVTSKHFIDWFFKLDNWVDVPPEVFNFSIITNNKNHEVYGYFNGDKLDGIVRLDEMGDYVEISFFCINPAIQGQGIGQQLLKFVLDKYADTKLVLYVYMDNKPAIHIYKKYGFKIMKSGSGIGITPEKSYYTMQKK